VIASTIVNLSNNLVILTINGASLFVLTNFSHQIDTETQSLKTSFHTAFFVFHISTIVSYSLAGVNAFSIKSSAHRQISTFKKEKNQAINVKLNNNNQIFFIIIFV